MMKMKSGFVGLGFVLSLMLLAGCTTSSAPKLSTGGNVKLAVYSDRGDPSTMEARQWDYRNEVGPYMEADLINRLRRAGYDVKLIQSPADYNSADGRYLLVTKMLSYNPGSAAARIIVGFGAGACSLDMQYTVLKGSTVLQQWKDGIGSSTDWHRLPRALNEKLVCRLNDELMSW